MVMKSVQKQPPPVPRRTLRTGKLSVLLSIPIVLILVGAAVVGLPAWYWFGWRIEVGPGEFMPLLQKTGKDIDNSMILADPEFKGPQFEVLKEGRHFKNPYTWSWPKKPLRAIEIPNGKVGILVRRHGNKLAPGEVVAASSDQKGIVREPKTPGRHYINTWAYDIEIKDMVKIEPGHMGVVTLLVGPTAKDAFGFTVADGERGAQPDLLPPGTHPQHSNPSVHRVTSIDVRSHKLDMSGENSIRFPSKYGFDIRVEGTTEWAPVLKKLPELFVKFVDAKDLEETGGIRNIEQKVILPYARSFFRTVGGSYRAVDYITGSTRIVVQNEVEKRLKDACAEEGILIKSVVIKATMPPQQIRKQYERREIARRLKDQYGKEIEMEVGDVVMLGQKPTLGPDGKPILDDGGKQLMTGGKPKLDENGIPISEGGRLKRVIMQRMKDREKKLGLVRETVADEVRAAEQYRAVELTQAQRKFEVATIKLEAAKDKAAAILAQGQAEAAVTVMGHKAEAEGIAAKVNAFETGEKYAEYMLILKLSPGIRQILSNTEGPFAKLFERFSSLEDEKGGK